MSSKLAVKLSASVLLMGVSLFATTPSQADGVADFNIGDTNVCIGLISCLFEPDTYGDRDADNVKDHRDNTTDHRAKRKNTVVPVKNKVRDHRTGATTTIRDHRVEPTVRDHRTKRKNEVVTIPRLDCLVGHEKLRRSGYDDIVANECDGAQYTYTARMGTGIFRALMHAYSGTMKVTYLGIADPN